MLMKSVKDGLQVVVTINRINEGNLISIMHYDMKKNPIKVITNAEGMFCTTTNDNSFHSKTI